MHQSSHSVEPAPGSSSSTAQHPGSPRFPQQFCRVRSFVQLFRIATPSLLKNGKSDSRQFANDTRMLGRTAGSSFDMPASYALLAASCSFVYSISPPASIISIMNGSNGFAS